MVDITLIKLLDVLLSGKQFFFCFKLHMYPVRGFIGLKLLVSLPSLWIFLLLINCGPSIIYGKWMISAFLVECKV